MGWVADRVYAVTEKQTGKSDFTCHRTGEDVWGRSGVKPAPQVSYFAPPVVVVIVGG